MTVNNNGPHQKVNEEDIRGATLQCRVKRPPKCINAPRWEVYGGVERALPNRATATTGSDYGVGPNIDPSPFQIGAEQKFVPRETAAAARRALTPRLYTEN